MTRTTFRASLLLASALWTTEAWAGAVQRDPVPAADGPATQAGTGAASASTPEDQNADIIVTAQKRSERLRDVPLSITAVSGDQLVRQGLSTPADLERIAPGFTFRQSQSGTPVFAIRGIGFYSEQVANAPTVTIYTDQIPLPYARMSAGAALDVERVEVLKGPQGTLFGQNSTAGAVNYIAAKPTDVYHAGFNLTAGRFGQADADAYVSGPIAEGLTFRLAARHEYRNQWQTNLTRDDRIGKRDFSTGRLLLEWRPSARLTIGLNLNGWQDRSDTQQSQARGYLPVQPGVPVTAQTIATAAALASYPYYQGTSNRIADWDPNVGFPRDDNFYQIAGTIRFDVTDRMRVTSISSYSHLKSLANIDADGTNYRALYILQSGLINSFTQEIRLEGSLGDLRWVAGGNYQHDRADELQRNSIRGSNTQILLPPPLAPRSFDGLNLYNNQKVSSKAAFANIDLSLTKRLSVQGGIRYTDEDRDFVGCLANNGTSTGYGATLGFPLTAPNQCVTLLANGTVGQVRSKLDQSNVSWRASLNYKPGDSSLLYVNVTKGYKSGGFGTLPAVTYQQLEPVRQESVLAYEAGVKTTLFDRRLDLAGAVFYDDYRNKQTEGLVNVQPFGNLPYLVNVPKSRIFGAEVELVLRPFPGLRLTGGANYLDTRINDQALVAGPFGPTVDARGERLPNAPKWQIQGGGEYEFALSGSVKAFLGASASYRTSTNAQLGGETGPSGTQDFFKISSYPLLDLRIGVELDNHLRIQAWGRNVTNQRYWNNVVHVYDTYSRITGMPATYGITLSGNF